MLWQAGKSGRNGCGDFTCPIAGVGPMATLFGDYIILCLIWIRPIEPCLGQTAPPVYFIFISWEAWHLTKHPMLCTSESPMAPQPPVYPSAPWFRSMTSKHILQCCNCPHLFSSINLGVFHRQMLKDKTLSPQLHARYSSAIHSLSVQYPWLTWIHHHQCMLWPWSSILILAPSPPSLISLSIPSQNPKCQP